MQYHTYFIKQHLKNFFYAHLKGRKYILQHFYNKLLCILNHLGSRLHHFKESKFSLKFFIILFFLCNQLLYTIFLLSILYFVPINFIHKKINLMDWLTFFILFRKNQKFNQLQLILKNYFRLIILPYYV